nr:hypothetical protein CFP56_20642 [Quercus suber]
MRMMLTVTLEHREQTSAGTNRWVTTKLSRFFVALCLASSIPPSPAWVSSQVGDGMIDHEQSDVSYLGNMPCCVRSFAWCAVSPGVHKTVTKSCCLAQLTLPRAV